MATAALGISWAYPRLPIGDIGRFGLAIANFTLTLRDLERWMEKKNTSTSAKSYKFVKIVLGGRHV